MARVIKKDGTKLRVCVLERGREILPSKPSPAHDGYPNSLEKVRHETQISTKRDHLTKDGTELFDLRIGDDVCVLVGCGLGGTSLINANVALELEEQVFDHEAWPAPFQQKGSEILARYYDRARKWLGANPYPASDAHLYPPPHTGANPSGASSTRTRTPQGEPLPIYPGLNKVEALKTSARAMKQTFSYPPINVTFKEGCNHAGVEQAACTLCGDCVTGCNEGANNTTLMNYLPDAKHHGADIFSYASVHHLEKAGTGWKVHIKNLQAPTDDPIVIEANIVILGAGTLGSTEILLRSRQSAGLHLSDKLGERFSGNGDVLAFGYNNNWTHNAKEPSQPNEIDLASLVEGLFGEDNRREIYGVGAGSKDVKPPKPSRHQPPEQTPHQPGPCIAGMIDMRHSGDPKHHLVIEEGVIPGALAPMLPPFFFFANAMEENFFDYGDTKFRLEDAQALSHVIRNRPETIVDEAYRGPVGRTQTYLVMSHDEAKGKLELNDDRVQVKWPGAGEADVYKRDDECLRQANAAVRGSFIPNPLWSEPLGQRVVTVHPIGGCAMGENGAKGVVNAKCQVFRDSESDRVYDNLYVCDGAVMPTSLGVNPLLTIAAMAEYACVELAKQHWGFDLNELPLDAPQEPLPKPDAPSKPALGGDEGGSGWNWDNILKLMLLAFINLSREQLLDILMEDLMEDQADIDTIISTRMHPLTQHLVGTMTEEELQNVNKMLEERLRQEFKEEVRQRIDELINYVIISLKNSANPDAESGAMDRIQTLAMELINTFPVGFSPSFSFSERMAGFYSDVSPYDPTEERPDSERRLNTFYIANKYGEALDQPIVGEFTVEPTNLHVLTTDPKHGALLTGTVTCEALSGSSKPMVIQQGILNLLRTDSERVETWTMTYHCRLEGEHGDTWHFEGKKIVHQYPESSVWSDVTTLYVTIYCDNEGEKGKLMGRGVMKLGLDDLVRQSATIKFETGHILSAWQEKLETYLKDVRYDDKKVWDYYVKPYVDQVLNAIHRIFAVRFAGFFSEVMFRAYGGLLANLADFPSQDRQTRSRRPLNASAPETHRIRTQDGVDLLLTRYPGDPKRPVVLAPGFGVRASSFATDTVSTNVVEYLKNQEDADYDVWLFDYRASPTLADSTPPFTLDDIALYDWPAAVSYICDITMSRNIQALVHCVGAMSFLMALLKGKLTRNGKRLIRSAICSQLTLHPITGWQNHLKADLGLIHILEDVLKLSKINLSSSPSAMDKVVDTLLWNVPVPDGEACKNPVCRRISAVYGPSYLHRQLNEDTHIALGEMFGEVHIRAFDQLSKIIQVGKVVDDEGKSTYLTRQNAKHLQLPITFIAGGNNQLFYPDTSALTLEWLRTVNPRQSQFYQRLVFPDYAHMDFFIGKSADVDIYPHLLQELNKHRA